LECGSGSRHPLNTRVDQQLEDIVVTLNWREKMQSAGDGSLVRWKGSGFEETQLCALSPRCSERHFPVNCLLFRKFPVQHRVPLLAAVGICKKCLSHGKGDGGRAEQCGGRHVENHWLCQFFSDPEGPGMEKRLLPAVVPQPGRLTYKCRTVIHVKSRSDLQTDRYSVQLTTLYDSNQRHSFIVNEVALALALRYMQVPERIVDISPTTIAKTTKLFILDVKPRPTAEAAGPQLVTAYGVDSVELTLPEKPRMNMLRSMFETRPGHLSNAGVAQPKAVAHLVIGRDNPVHMPEVITRSIRGGSDLYFMRNDLFPGEMLVGETDRGGSKKKKAAGGPKTTSTPKPRNPPAASKKVEKAAQVRTPLVANKWPDTTAEEQPIASASGIKGRRRQDSSPAMSLAASDSMVSSLGRTASATPVREGGERKKSISREPALVYARKSRIEETAQRIWCETAAPVGPARPAQRAWREAAAPAGPARPAQEEWRGTAAPAVLAQPVREMWRGTAAPAVPARPAQGVERGTAALAGLTTTAPVKTTATATLTAGDWRRQRPEQKLA
jgi:hypothetical protein